MGSSAALSRAFRHTGLIQSQPFLCPPDMGTGKYLELSSTDSILPARWNHQTAHSCQHRRAWCHLAPACPPPTVYSGAFQDPTCCQSIYKGHSYSLELPGSLNLPLKESEYKAHSPCKGRMLTRSSAVSPWGSVLRSGSTAGDSHQGTENPTNPQFPGVCLVEL